MISKFEAKEVMNVSPPFFFSEGKKKDADTFQYASSHDDKESYFLLFFLFASQRWKDSGGETGGLLPNRGS